MAKLVKNILLSSLLVSGVMAADSDVKSLVGFEGGYSDAEFTTAAGVDETAHVKQGGLKIGAESKNYRFFIGANYLDNENFDKAMMYGASIQYMINFSDYINLYAGPTIGRVDISDKFSNDYKDTYYGADIGFNVHLGESLDLELGARHVVFDAEAAGTELEDMSTVYGSLIFKFDLEDM